MKYLSLVGSIALAFALTACSSKKEGELPTCGSEETVSLLKKKMKEYADQQKVQFDIKFQDFTVEAKNKDQQKIVCKAKVTGNYGKTVFDASKASLYYSAQYTEDGKILIDNLNW